MDKFKISIGGLKDGEHIYEFAVLPGEIDPDDVNVAGNVLVTVKLSKTGNQITADIALKGRYLLDCDICTEKYQQPFENYFRVIYKFEFREEPESDEEIKFIHPNTKYIDLRDDIRDFVLLSVPMKRVPDAVEGKCSYCGKSVDNLLSIKRQEEINPVWEKLIKVKTK